MMLRRGEGGRAQSRETDVDSQTSTDPRWSHPPNSCRHPALNPLLLHWASTWELQVPAHLPLCLPGCLGFPTTDADMLRKLGGLRRMSSRGHPLRNSAEMQGRVLAPVCGAPHPVPGQSRRVTATPTPRVPCSVLSPARLLGRLAVHSSLLPDPAARPVSPHLLGSPYPHPSSPVFPGCLTSGASV